MQNYLVLLGLALAPLAKSHMYMSDPPALRTKDNKNTPEGKIDYTPTAPITAAQFPCKGYLSDLGTPGGASVATWAPGSSQSFTIVGGAPHGGGSCQASLSVDGGKTYKVIQSIHGGCPVAGAKVPFTVPSDTPTGDAVFAWTWFNNIGNREMYMNCAVVSIGGGAFKAKMIRNTKRADVAFSARPNIFVANINNGCTVKEGSDVIFPDPGPNVSGKTGKSADTIEGTCQAVQGNGGTTGSGGSGSGSGSGSSPASSAASPAAPAAPATSQANVGGSPATGLPGGVFATVQPPSAPAPSSGSGSGQGSGNGAGKTVTSTLLGGVFATVAPPSVPTASGAPTVPDATPTPAPASPSPSNDSGSGSNDPSPVESSTPAAPTPGTSTGESGAQSGPCTNEGAWNCIGGTSFQRCASGTWSAIMQVAAGTKCTAPGISNTFAIDFAKREIKMRSVKFARARLA